MPEKILIIDDDVDTLRLVGLMLQKQGYQILAASNGQQGLDLAFEQIPDLILLDVMMPAMDGYEVAKRLRAHAPTAGIPILMFTAKTQLDDKVAGFEAGADDYLTKPTHPSELQAHVKALLARSGKSAAGPSPTVPPAESPALTIGVISPRGGLGVTTIAANLASALRQRTNADVLLIEMRPGLGALAADVGLPEPKGLSALLDTPVAELTRQKVGEAVVKHPSGLLLIPASSDPADADKAITCAAQTETIISRARFMVKYLVVDLGSGLSDINRKICKQCDEILVLTEPMPNTVTQSRSIISHLIQDGKDKRRINAILNLRTRSDVAMTANQVTERINHPIAVTTTAAPEWVIQGQRKNTTAFFAQPDGLNAQQYVMLANQILERSTPKKTP